MGKRLYPLQRIKYWYAYDVNDVCGLYAEFKLHQKTVQGWIKNGLSTIDKGKPSLIYGYDLKIFLQKMNASNKCGTKFHEMFCMKCKEGKAPLKKQITLEQINGFVKAKGICNHCKSTMNKSYKMLDMPKLRNTFNVVDVLELYDSKTPTVKTPLQAPCDKQEKESKQVELFL